MIFIFEIAIESLEMNMLSRLLELLHTIFIIEFVIGMWYDLNYDCNSVVISNFSQTTILLRIQLS